MHAPAPLHEHGDAAVAGRGGAGDAGTHARPGPHQEPLPALGLHGARGDSGPHHPPLLPPVFNWRPLEKRRSYNRRMASRVDKFCRFAFPFVFFVFNIVYWPYYIMAARSQRDNSRWDTPELA